MSKAEMECSACNREWTYSGLAKSTCFCPFCGAQNRLSTDATKVINKFGVPYQ